MNAIYFQCGQTSHYKREYPQDLGRDQSTLPVPSQRPHLPVEHRLFQLGEVVQGEASIGAKEVWVNRQWTEEPLECLQ